MLPRFPSTTVINLFDFDVGVHTLLIEATDARGTTTSFVFTFEVEEPPPGELYRATAAIIFCICGIMILAISMKYRTFIFH